MVKTIFNKTKRKELENLVKTVTINPTVLAVRLNVSVNSIYRELKKGLKEQDYTQHQYQLYSASLAQKTAETYTINNLLNRMRK